MPKRKRLPVVAICGRPNVGKSTLYNRIVGKQRAIIHDLEGITRDRHVAAAQWRDHAFELVDTGGIVESPIDPIVRKMQDQVRRAIEESRVVIFVVDGREPLTRVDYEVRDELFKYGKPVVLAVNKLDNVQLAEHRHEYYELGIGEPIAVSATHGRGVEDLMEAVAAHLPEPTAVGEEAAEEAAVVHVAVVGKPNVGKSSFVNAILGEERTIVHETPGTTRDAIDIEFRWKDHDYVLIDTAGMRKKAGIKEAVEHFSIARSLRAIRRADVCLLLVDATEGIGEQDKRIASYAVEQGTAMVLVWTKWDLVADKERRFTELRDEVAFKAPFLRYVPALTISNVARTRLFKSFEVIDRVAAEAFKRIPTGELNQFFSKIKEEHKPSGHKGKTAKILYATQTGVKPTVFVLFVNQRRLFHFSYLRYIENRLREEYGFEGVPIRIELREGKPKP